MPTPPLSEQSMRAILEAVRKHGGVLEAAAALNLTRGTAQSRWTRAKAWAKKTGIPVPTVRRQNEKSEEEPDANEETIVSGDTSQIKRRTTEDVRTLEDL